MLKGESFGIAATFGAIIVVFVVLGIFGVLTGTLVEVNTQLGVAKGDIANIQMKHVIKECFVRKSGGIITQEFLEKFTTVKKECGFDSVTAAVVVDGKSYTFGGRGGERILVPVKKGNKIVLGELWVNTNA